MMSKQEIWEIVEKMTLEEKAALCSGRDFWHLEGFERLGVPSVMVSDGPHGLRKQDDKADHLGVNDSIKAVCFPAGCATACSFDEELPERLGRTLGRECRAENVSVLLGPAINMKRSPLCGRNFEYYSEDPFLAGKTAAAFVRGVQSWQVGVSVKHFAANNQEFRRMSGSSNMDERTLREIYLAAFETAVKEARPWTLMCSYNRINGVFASENRKLLTDILRAEWGFDGYVMSDWGAVNVRTDALRAGLELEMPGPCPENDAELVQAMRSGDLDEAVLDQAAERILDVVFRYCGAQVPQAVFDREADHKIAVELEKECAVLLKNDGLLPLSRGAKLAYLGGFAARPRYQGGGSSHINASRVSSALSCAPDGVIYEEGSPADRDVIDEAAFARAVQAAKEADAAVIFAGLPDSFESEGYDRQHMRLPDCQNELIRRVLAVQKRVVVVLHCGSPVETPWADEASSVLCVYLGGEGVGEATDALLYGDANPCGRLAETWPMKLEDNPSYLNFPGCEEGVNYAEGVFIGYRYYDKKKMPVRWPFGHGESYTGFAYSNVRLSAGTLADGGEVTVLVDVTNTGARAGKEAVQLYVADRTGTPGRPEKELKGYVKLALEPGETKTAQFTVNARSLSWYSEALGDWYAAPGQYELLVAHSSRDVRGSVSLAFSTEKRLPLRVHRNTTIGALLADPRTAPILKAAMSRGKPLFGGEEQESAAAEAITEEMSRQMMVNAPLRAAQLFLGMSRGEIEALIAELQRAVDG